MKRPNLCCLLLPVQLTLAAYLSDIVNKPLGRLSSYYKQDIEQRHNNWLFNPRALTAIDQHWDHTGVDNSQFRAGAEGVAFPNVKEFVEAARNVILVLVEGLDSHTMSAARQILETQTTPVNNYMTAVDYFLSGYLKPASRDFIVADPPAATSAMFNGLPEYNGQMGWVEQEEATCLGFNKSKKLLKNLFKVMSEAGKMTALLSTARLTSPGVAGTFAASPDMQIESDIHLVESGCNDGKFKDIAAQLIKDYKGLNFIIGRGREYFMKSTNRDLASNSSVYPWRTDLDLKNYWTMEKLLRKKTFKDAIGTQAVKDALRGQDNLQYFLGFLDEDQATPSPDDLQDLVSLVVNALNGKPNQNGYFLTIYDDQLSRDHENDAFSLGSDLNNIFKAINYLDKVLTRGDDTLIVLASVQGSTLTLSSGRLHEQTILGSGLTDTCETELSRIRYPYGSRPSNNWTGVVRSEDPVGGPDLPVFARGPGSQVFTGINDFAYTYHAILYATCLSEGASGTWEHCSSALTPSPLTTRVPPPDAITTRGPITGGATTTRRPTLRPPIWPWLPQPLPLESGNPYGNLGVPYNLHSNEVSQPKPLPNSLPNSWRPTIVVNGNRSPNNISRFNQIPARNPMATDIPPISRSLNTNVIQNRNPAPLPNSNPTIGQNPFGWASLFPFFI